MPQPYFVPGRFSTSRITQSRGMSAGTSTDTAFPFTVRLKAIRRTPSVGFSNSAAAEKQTEFLALSTLALRVFGGFVLSREIIVQAAAINANSKLLLFKAL